MSQGRAAWIPILQSNLFFYEKRTSTSSGACGTRPVSRHFGMVPRIDRPGRKAASESSVKRLHKARCRAARQHHPTKFIAYVCAFGTRSCAESGRDRMFRPDPASRGLIAATPKANYIASQLRISQVGKAAVKSVACICLTFFVSSCTVLQWGSRQEEKD